MTKKNVLILGSGVSGLTTALTVLKAGHKVTIWSKEASGEFPHTSANAYAMWWPFQWPEFPGDNRAERWANETRMWFEALVNDATAGVTMRRNFCMKISRVEPWFAHLDCFRHALPGEVTADYVDAHVLDKAPVIEPAVYLSWLRNSIVAAGGKFVEREIASFAECPAEFDAVVNCTGLGSRKLANDTKLRPSRLQVVKIKPNGIQDVMWDDEGVNAMACIVPHKDYVQLGAAHDMDQESLDTDIAVTQGILARCARMAPAYKFDIADVVSVTRALRPARSNIRVEAETQADGRVVFHNYGHDSTGYMASYGCAKEILGLLESAN
jgi:D-amino-acid oxidase